MCKISVIVPMYNVSLYLKDCVESLLKQKIDKEIILIDDGSTDDTFSIAKEYADKYHFITLLSQENSGQSVARNKGIGMAKGEYIFFCDSDDFIDSNSLGKLYSLCKENNLDYIKTGWKTYYSKKNIITNTPPKNMPILGKTITSKEFFLSSIIHWYNVIPVNGLYRTQWLKDNGMIYPENIQFEDNTFHLNVCLKDLSAKAMLIEFPFYYARIREHSTTTECVKPKKINDILENIKLMNDFIDTLKDETLKKEARRAVSSLTFTMTSYYYRLNKGDRKLINKTIPRKVLKDSIKYPQNSFQKLKMIAFTYFKPLLNCYEYYHMRLYRR